MRRQMAVVAIMCGIGAGCGGPGADDGDVVERQQALAVSRTAVADTGAAPVQKVAVTSRASVTLDAKAAASTTTAATTTTPPATATTTATSTRVAAQADLTAVSAGTLSASPGIIATPARLGMMVTASSVTVSWTDASSNELRFIVYRRDVQGNWQAVHTLPTNDMAGGGDYLWVDTDKSLSAQCYVVTAANDETAASTAEWCVVRPDPAVFPQAVPSEVQDWYGLSFKNDTAAPLNKRGSDMFLQYEDRTFGVSLGWTETSQNNVKLERQGTSPMPLMKGEAVAIRVWGGGWLAHGIQSFGVDLVLSDTPVYEWYVVSGAPAGTQLDNGAFALWNKSAQDYLVPGDQVWGVGLNWYQKTLPPDYSTPTSPPPGVKTFVVYNCQSEGRSVEMWVEDLTAGTGWVDRGTLDAEWSSAGCPTTGQPWIFTPTSGHQYIVRGIDFSAPDCSNSPSINSCTASETTFVGDANGQIVSTTVD